MEPSRKPDPSAPPPGEGVTCPQCSAPAAAGLNFCGECGTDLRGLGVETDTLVGVSLGVVIDGRYKVHSKLGEGGMGTVYKVEHTRMGKMCALKLLRPGLLQGREARAVRERFKQEARIVSKLVHVNTIQVFDFGEQEDGSLYLVMEYIKGVSLADVLGDAGGRLPEGRVALIAIQILRSLAEAHETGIVHRDIKPANVMLLDLRDRKDFVKVLDFGIAKITGGREGERDTGVNELVGTPNYMSPEQAKGEKLDARSDLYSLGAMMFELLSGRAPYVADTPLGVVTAHITEPLPDILEVAPISVSSPMQSILRRAMAKDPAARYADADAMRTALENLAGRDVINTTGEFDITNLLSPTLDPIAVRADFEEFARNLVLKRFLTWLIPVAMLAAGGGALYGWLLQATAPLTAEVEPNDAPVLANLLTPDTAPNPEALQVRRMAAGDDPLVEPLRVVEGYLGKRLTRTDGDVDWYRIEVPIGEPKLLFIELGGVPNIDIVLEVLSERKDAPGKLAVVARSDAPGEGAFEGIPNLEVGPGVYLIQVRQVQVGDLDGRLPLPVENVSDPYRLSVVLMPFVESDEMEVEPNDTWREAAGLPIGRSRQGLLGVTGAVDWWKVFLPEGRHLHATVSGVPHARVKLQVWDEARLARQNRKPIRSAKSGFGKGVQVRAPVKDMAFVRVSVVEGSNLIDRYTLSLEAIDPIKPTRRRPPKRRPAENTEPRTDEGSEASPEPESAEPAPPAGETTPAEPGAPEGPP